MNKIVLTLSLFSIVCLTYAQSIYSGQPMTLHLAEANDNPDKVAIMYGPLVLAGAMGIEGMNGTAPYSDPQKFNDYYTYDYNVPDNLITTLKLDKNNLLKSIKLVAGETTAFITTNENIRLEPIHQIHHQRYVVYWDIVK